MKSQYVCPNCHVPLALALKLTANEYSVWCGNGRCKPISCDNGGTGATELEAYNELVKAYEKERDSKEET